MNTNTATPAGLLHQIADIQRMEPGKLCIMREGKNGPYYNLQWRENGKTVSRYVPREEVKTVEENTVNFRTFHRLVEEYADQIITRTREERRAAQKESRRNPSSSAKRKNSNS